MELKVYKRDGSELGKTVKLNDEIFNIDVNDHAIWLDVRQYLANCRQGTHSSKEKSTLSGSTRKLKKQKGNTKKTINSIELGEILPETMKSSILSSLIVGGYIAIFYLIIELFSHFGLFNPILLPLTKLLSPLGISSNAIESVLFGVVEISKGCLNISNCGLNINISASIASFLISFGGFCTFFQAITFLKKCKINFGFYLFQKLTHGIISFFITLVLTSLFQ